VVTGGRRNIMKTSRCALADGEESRRMVMATVTGPVKQSPSAKYDAIVEVQLERARKRIRTLDLMTALLGFVAGTLAYGAVMALLDNALTLPAGVLYAGFFVYLLAALAYLGSVVVRTLTQRHKLSFPPR